MEVRAYEPADERSWLRCRVLSFLGTAYYDDVRRTRVAVDPPGFGLVVADGGDVIGLIDVEVAGDLATIDTIAVHPDHQHRGIGRALLAETRARLHDTAATTLDAWTRDDADTLRWYRAAGFTESEHYLHVYANHYTDAAEPARAVTAAQRGLTPVAVFLHGRLADEATMRERFQRVHVCRRFSMPLQKRSVQGHPR